MRILLFGFGENAMLAWDIFRVFNSKPGKYKFIMSDIKPLDLKDPSIELISKNDITDQNSIRPLFKSRPDMVINASAYTDVDGCEDKPELAFAVNAKGAENIATCASAFGIPVVHISTDYVFDGKWKRPYSENDPVNPLGVYGKSKLEGELAVKRLLTAFFFRKNYYICRTALLYGSRRDNFPKKILAQAKAGKVITVPDDMYGSPTWSVDLADMLERLIHTGKYGVYHTVNTGSCSRYEWAVETVKAAGLNAEIKPIKTADIKASKAPRPLYSTLDNFKLQGEIGKVRPWQEALRDFVREEMRVSK